MIHNWNLGDVCFRNVARFNAIMPRLMGRKRLVLGNHDHYDVTEYKKYFRIEPCWRQFKDFPKKFICTHVPVHPRTLQEGRFDGKQVYNVHGHIHVQVVIRDGSPCNAMPDPRFINICVEHRNYTPVHVDELMRLMI